MSLLPLIFEDFYSRPAVRRKNSDFLSPIFWSVPSFGSFRPRTNQNELKDIGSNIITDKDKFQINLDVKHFSPEEITVKVSGKNMIIVEGKHEEKEDEHGFISRQFVRKYILPKGHNIEELASKLSSDGVLTITAPKIPIESGESRNIPIIQTGVPSKSVTKGNQQKEDSKIPVEMETN